MVVIFKSAMTGLEASLCMRSFNEYKVLLCVFSYDLTQ